MTHTDPLFDVTMASPASSRKDSCLDWIQDTSTLVSAKQATLPTQVTTLNTIGEIQFASPASLDHDPSASTTAFFPPPTTTNGTNPLPNDNETHDLINILTLNNPSGMPFTHSLSLLTQHSRLFALLAQDPTQFTPVSSALHKTFELNIEHETFTVFDRWLRRGAIHDPIGNEKYGGYATDVYLLMRAHAMGEMLGAGVFGDAVMDEIINLLTVEEDGGLMDGEVDIERLDAAAKARDLDILIPAAAAIWPAGSMGREFFTDFVAHAPSYLHSDLAIETLLDTGDLHFAALLVQKMKARQLDFEIDGGLVVPSYISDPCRYHGHRAAGLPCYKRSRGSVFCGLDYVVRKGLAGEDGDSGYGGDEGEGKNGEGDRVFVDDGGLFGD